MNAADDLREKVEAFPYWYHHIALPYGLFTPGWAPINADAYRIPDDLTGKRVLDIGAWDGYWTFEALKRGAKEVVAIDDFSNYMGNLAKDDRKGWETFDLCRSVLGYSDEKCKRIEMSVYDISEENLGCFDVVFLFGVIYHLRHPLLALDKIAEICAEELCVESAILDDYSPYQGGLGHGYPGRQMVMEYYPDNQYGGDGSNWWAPTLFCLMNMVKAAGFAYVEGWKFEEPPELPFCRGFAKGTKNLPEGPVKQGPSEPAGLVSL
jgi:tRNA (mo5U34)-methyltransferase